MLQALTIIILLSILILILVMIVFVQRLTRGRKISKHNQSETNHGYVDDKAATDEHYFRGVIKKESKQKRVSNALFSGHYRKKIGLRFALAF